MWSSWKPRKRISLSIGLRGCHNPISVWGFRHYSVADLTPINFIVINNVIAIRCYGRCTNDSETLFVCSYSDSKIHGVLHSSLAVSPDRWRDRGFALLASWQYNRPFCQLHSFSFRISFIVVRRAQPLDCLFLILIASDFVSPKSRTLSMRDVLLVLP